MKKEEEAIYIGKHKIGYRAEFDNVRGLLYKKNSEEIFVTYTQLMRELRSGPCIRRYSSEERKCFD